MVKDPNPFVPQHQQGLGRVSEEAQRRLRQMFPWFPSAGPRPLQDRLDEPEPQSTGESEFVSKAEAAKILGVNQRTIYRYILAGRLRMCPHGRHRGVRRSDLRQLQREREDPQPFAINQRLMARIGSQIRITRMELELCKEALNLRWKPLGLTGEQLVERHREAREHAAACPPERIPGWIEFLARLRHVDLETIEALTNDAQPWVPFFLLAARIEPTMDQEIREPSLKKLLAAGREHVDMLVYAWIVGRYGESAMRQIIADLARRSSQSEGP